MSNYITIKLRRGTATQWSGTNPILAEGEIGLETNTRKFKVGDGVTAWNSLTYWGGSGSGASSFVDLLDVPNSYTGQGGKGVRVKADASGLEFYSLAIAAGDLPSGIDAAKIADGSVSNAEFQRLNGVTSDIQTQFAGKVPYSGATQNVDLGEYELKAGQITLDTTPTGTPAVATTQWNDTNGTTETTLKGGSVILKNGVDLVARVVNKVSPSTTLTKAAYQAVKISGAQGQRLAIGLAQANNDANSADTLGLVIETIASNQEGFIITMGQISGVNTTGSLQGETWADGDVLYLSPTTAGAITNIKPTAPNHTIIIGYVEYSHAVNGKIYVKIMNGWELGELHDVDLTESKTTPVDTDNLFLQDSADSSIWKLLSWANLKARLKTYFDTLYQAAGTYLTSANIVQTITNGVTDKAPSEDAVFDALAGKQATLQSGTNIKTINGNSLLGSGDLTISGGGGYVLGEKMTYIEDYMKNGLPDELQVFNSGTGSGFSYTNLEGHPGNMYPGPGTSAGASSGYAYATFQNQQTFGFYVADGDIRFGGVFKMPSIIFSATEDYELIFGCNASNFGLSNYGVRVLARYSDNSGKLYFQYYTTSAQVTIVANNAGALVADTWYSFEATVTGTNHVCEFFVNGVSEGTGTPASKITSGQTTGWGWHGIRKHASAGAHPRPYIDVMLFEQTLNR